MQTNFSYIFLKQECILAHYECHEAIVDKNLAFRLFLFNDS